MSTLLYHRIARKVLPKPAREAWGRLYWRLLNWWLWDFSVQPNFFLFVPAYIITTWLMRKPVVAVYQPGRVGSTAVTSAIRIAYRGLVFHVHSLSPESHEEILESRNRCTPELEHYILHRQSRVARCLRWVLHRRAPLKIVVLLRDPIAQSLSGFFYNFTTLTGHSLEEKAWTPLELLRLYWVTNTLLGFKVFEQWFDYELCHFTGMDVMAEPFDRMRGWQEYRDRNLSLLVMKIELSDAMKNAALSSFLGLNELQIRVKNSAEEQSYAGLYRAFREKFALSQEQLDEVYANQFARHFYTAEEIGAFKQKWMKREN